MQAGILHRHEEGVVERRVISSDRGAHPVQNLRTIPRKKCGAREITAVGVESNLIRGFQRSDKVDNCVLCKDKLPVHVIAGVKQDEYIGARNQ